MVAAAGSAGEYDDAPAINLDHLLSIGKISKAAVASVREIVASARPWFQAAINKRRDLYLHWEDVVPALEAFGAAEAAEAAAACDGLPHLRLLAADAVDAPTPLTPGSAVRVKTVAPPRAVHTLRVRALLEGTDGHAVPLRARTRPKWSA